jgi:hypothetical protein
VENPKQQLLAITRLEDFDANANRPKIASDAITLRPIGCGIVLSNSTDLSIDYQE